MNKAYSSTKREHVYTLSDTISNTCPSSLPLFLSIPLFSHAYTSFLSPSSIDDALTTIHTHLSSLSSKLSSLSSSYSTLSSLPLSLSSIEKSLKHKASTQHVHECISTLTNSLSLSFNSIKEEKESNNIYLNNINETCNLLSKRIDSVCVSIECKLDKSQLPILNGICENINNYTRITTHTQTRIENIEKEIETHTNIIHTLESKENIIVRMQAIHAHLQVRPDEIYMKNKVLNVLDNLKMCVKILENEMNERKEKEENNKEMKGLIENTIDVIKESERREVKMKEEIQGMQEMVCTYMYRNRIAHSYTMHDTRLCVHASFLLCIHV